MRCVAQFDLTADISASDDAMNQPIEHPNGEFKFIIRRKTVNEDSGTVTLHCNMEFDATKIDQAQDTFMGYLVRVLNVVVLVTHSSVRFHRVHKIFDLSPGKTMRQGFMYVYDPPEPVPMPFLSPLVLDTAALLLNADIEEKASSALRWFRLGVAAENPEDQFQHFWFALELLATHEKPSEEVHDSCSKCHEALYCKTCEEYPKHKPYPKQAIAYLCNKLAPEIPDFFPLAEKARNMMMHGSSKEKIEKKIRQPIDQIIDPMGRIVWLGLLNVLVNAIPKEARPEQLNLGQATTFVRWNLSAAALIETVIPLGPDGKPDIELLAGIEVGFTR